ncbi:MAG: aminotransferase class V-fold PLP-dependent enzyme [Holosporales bacterium]|jgi:cysteine desulfurase|nr:aminotransferase class V-fold PLP-dependent enzyme [Holosporales bacterium]
MKKIYLDNQATTRCDPRVVEAMIPYFCEDYGNPTSDHEFGYQASTAVEKAREQVAKIIGAQGKDIVFTSGATIAANTAIIGCARFYERDKNHIITSSIEHKCVLESCKFLHENGFEISYIDPDSDGIVSPNSISRLINDKTVIVSVMAVNNEIGTIQPIREIGEICRSRGVIFHTDAAQAVGKIDIDVVKDNIAILTLSGHKMYGPKGIGAMYIRSIPKIRVNPLIFGGGQERKLAPGTIPVPLCVGLGKACELIREEMHEVNQKIESIKSMFFEHITQNLTQIYLNGHKNRRVPHNLNISFAGVEGESLMMSMPGIAISSGSACTSDTLEPSHVLKAIGIRDDLVHTAIRFGFGRFTTESEAAYVAEKIVENVRKLRSMSPTWNES